MFNLIVHGYAGYLEQPDLDMPVDRFDTYSGQEAEGLNWDDATDFKRLEGVPTLLMYEVGVDGENAGLVRYGRVTNVRRYGGNVSFEFILDADRPFLDRDLILKFETHLDMHPWEQGRTHWAIKDGDIPPKLLEQAMAVLSEGDGEAGGQPAPDSEGVAHPTRGPDVVPAVAADTPAAAEMVQETARVVALVIGIENYRTGQDGIKPVDYARADAEAFARALEIMFEAQRPEISVLIDQDATLNDIREEIKSIAYGLGPDDLFIFYYAGHGFHGGDGNRLTAWDSRPINFAGTTLSVHADLLQPVRASACERVLAFVDACASNLRTAARDVLAEFNPQELRAFMDSAQYISLFLSCAHGQKSFGHDSLKHGIWTYFLLKALEGEPRALGAGGILTSTSLQDYLSAEVPRFTSTNLKATQTPIAILEATRTFSISTFPAQAEPVIETSAVPVAAMGAARDVAAMPTYNGTSTQFFFDRFRTAFPGVRNVRWFTQPEDIKERLAILLKDPLEFEGKTPVWWWRDGNLQIEHFSSQDDGTYLMNFTELNIEKIAAIPGSLYWQSCVYVQCGPMAPSGAYDDVEDRIRRHLERWHYSWEEYGRMDDGVAVTRDEYDDGGAEIAGRVVDLNGRVRLRSRYLTPYNFVIAPVGSPINNSSFDQKLVGLLDAVLDDEANFSALLDEIAKLPRRTREV